MDQDNMDLENELRNLNERSVDLKIRQEEELRELGHRVESEEF